jgi:predicted KAP-like P-loop ATPase
VVPLIRHTDQTGLEELALAKVREAAKDDSLLTCPKLPELLSLWKELAGDAEPKNWLTKIVADDHNLANLLEKFLEKDFSHTMLKIEGGSRYRLNHRTLEAYLEPASLLGRVRTLAKSTWLSELQKVALRQFLEIYKPKGH